VDQRGDLPSFAQIQPENLHIWFDCRNAFGGNSDVAIARATDGSDDVVTEQRPMVREVMSNETRNACNDDFSHVKSAPWVSRVETPMKVSKTHQGENRDPQPKLLVQGALPA